MRRSKPYIDSNPNEPTIRFDAIAYCLRHKYWVEPEMVHAFLVQQCELMVFDLRHERSGNAYR